MTEFATFKMHGFSNGIDLVKKIFIDHLFARKLVKN